MGARGHGRSPLLQDLAVSAAVRYIVETSGKETLYDIVKDPGEYQDVAGDPAYAPALAELRLELLRRLMEMERPVPRIWPY